MSSSQAEDPLEGSGELQLPDLLLAAAFARRGDGPSSSQVTEVRAGVELGGYRILHRIGSGGMGTVYAAEQKSPRRRVALKLLSPSRASKAMVRRFQQEAHLLGGLQHPGIAQVHEAGSVELEELAIPLHYLALELVEGAPLDVWAREQGLDLRARLELVARVCDAVQHAHQRGVIHRDLKPGNVLVVSDERGGPGQPKVLDFGVARALTSADEPADRSLVTQAGQVLGTLAYMSPEQAAGDSAEVDTRSDVYALGVILYRLLCDALPVDVQGLGLIESAQRLRDVVPERPSARVAGLDGELDTIALKALEKSSSERYGSAAELAADLRRYLRGEPILAREHSALYVLRKAIARNRTLALAAALSALLLVVFALVSGLQARRNRILARSESAARETLALELRRSNLDRARLFAMAGNLSAAEELSWTELLHSPDSDEALWALRDLYRRFPSRATWRVSPNLLWSLVALPDGRLVSLGYDGALHEHDPQHDLAPGPARWQGSSGLQRLLATSDASRLVRSSGEGALDVFDAARLELLYSRPLREAGFDGFEGNALALDSDDRAWVGMGDGRLLHVELAPDGAVIEVLRLAVGINDVCVSPSGSRLGLGDVNGGVALVDATRGGVLWSSDDTGDAVGRMAFSPDERLLYAGGRDRKVRVFEVDSGRLRAVWEAPNGSVRQIVPDADGERVLVGGWWSLDEWSLARSERRVLLPFPSDCFLALPESGLFVSSGHGLLKVWDARAVAPPAPLVRARERTAARFLGDGSRLAVGDGAGLVLVVETQGGRVLHEVAAHPRRVRALASGSDGAALWTGTEEGDVACLDVASGEVLQRFGPAATMTTDALALHPDGLRLAYNETPTDVVVRDLAQEREVVRIAGLRGVNGLTWMPDGERLALVERPRSLRLFSAAGAPLAEVETPEDLWTVCASADGRLLAASAWGGDIYLYDARDLAPRGRLEGHFTTVWDLCFLDRAARHLFSAAGDGTVRLWDVASGRCVLVLDEFDGWEALSVDVARDGRRVALAGSNGEVVLLDLYAADRCIAGNLDYRLQTLAERGAPVVDAARVSESIRAALVGP